jgi:hypothetical protein
MLENNTPQSCLSAIKREVESALQDAKIYDIDSCWLNETDPDPELIGHAMWQIDQPQIDYNDLWGELPILRRPAEVEKQILTLGEDFDGLMRTSRLSLGLSLVWAVPAKANVLNESTYFWLHRMNAFLNLAIASDRLRDLLIVACAGDAPKVFKKKCKQNHWYVTPFKNAGQLLLSRGFSDQRLEQPLADLPQEAKDIYQKIKRRNSIVHELATRIAKQVNKSIADIQRRYDDEQKKGFQPIAANLPAWASQETVRMSDLRSEIDSAVTELRDWYSLLIKASNNVFQVEYWSRRLGKG